MPPTKKNSMKLGRDAEEATRMQHTARWDDNWILVLNTEWPNWLRAEWHLPVETKFVLGQLDVFSIL